MNGHETPRRTTPWRETWRQLIRSAAPHQVALRRSLLELLAAAALQGMALQWSFTNSQSRTFLPSP